METYDVIVIGLGGMGSAAAHHLAARGRRVLGLERFGPAHDQGASHGGSRITRQTYFEDPAYVPLLLRSYELWAALERDSGRDLMDLCGGIMIGAPDSLTVAGSRRSSEQWGLPHEMLDAAEIRRRFPNLRPQPHEVGLYERKAGLVRPEETVRANLDRASALGATLRFEEPVTGWTSSSSAVEVRTARGTYSAGALVICPGPWAPSLLADLGIPFSVERQVQFFFQPVGGVSAYLPDRQPIFIWEGPPETQVYGFPALDGPSGGVKVAFFRGGEVTTPETIDRSIRPDEIAAVAAHLADRVPGVAGTYLRGKTCMYTNTLDTHFVIGRHPGHANVTVACGFSGHGFKFVPVVGEILADLALTGATRHPLGLFDPRRFCDAHP
ncbi:N-methyl-L-tryptophan oxidase [Dactylosporangium sp. NPDC050588]|uniref:N-methyl-L-tryptophan oxidase n=1 Tax=Dactylosporangium sp. NPDC050588 TaxID=3157211 RepID=UPI0033E3BD6D